MIEETVEEEEAKRVAKELTPEGEEFNEDSSFDCLKCGEDVRMDYIDLNPHTDEEEIDWEQVRDHFYEFGKYCCYCLHMMNKND